MNNNLDIELFFKNKFWHLLFWVLLWIIYSFSYPQMTGVTDYVESFAHHLFFLTGQIVITYWTLYFLFPRFFLRKQYFLFGLYFILSLVVVTLFQRAINLYIYYPFVYLSFFDKGIKLSYDFWNFLLIVQTFLVTYPTAIIALCGKVIVQWYQSQRKLREAEKEQLYSELKYLQSQIHPHFFFNTLNNLYGLALAKSDTTPALILKLSDLMRYMLYEANVSYVPLKKEIHHLENYIELEKIRYKSGFDIFFKQRGEITKTKIAPLLLLPFVENAFKHGFSESMVDAWISIDLEVKGNSLFLKVENSLPEENLNSFETEKGLGLKNVRRRLDLLYSENYELAFTKTDHIHSVNLAIHNLNIYENKLPVGR